MINHEFSEEDVQNLNLIAEIFAKAVGPQIRDYRKECWNMVYTQTLRSFGETDEGCRTAARVAAHSLRLFDLTFQTGADTTHLTATPVAPTPLRAVPPVDHDDPDFP